MAEVQQQRLHELLVQQMTRAVPVAVRVARNPLLEGHLALHVGRVVLNVRKCLMHMRNGWRVIAPEDGRGLAPAVRRSAKMARKTALTLKAAEERSTPVIDSAPKRAQRGPVLQAGGGT